ncbi:MULTISPECIES: type II secretion system protein [unclassified Vibrio]|uniref:type II secretion system protein n=2 Tax=Vibrio TaxID=662 RepID=UPI00354E5647
MKKQSGFTLIELVVVIVILGILAVTAAPRFLNLQGDAREASLQGLRGAMAGASGIVFGRAAIEGVENITAANNAALADGTTLHLGYPAATSAGIVAVVDGLDVTTTGDWAVFEDAANDTLFATFQTGTALIAAPTTCFVSYLLNEAGTNSVPPTVTVDNTGC